MLLCSTTAVAHSYSVEILGKDKGFEKSNFISITQDKSGFLWFCTQTGLIQYTGANTKKYIPASADSNGLLAEFYYQAYEDAQQFLWLASRNGFYRMDFSRKQVMAFFKEKRNPNSIPNNRVFSLLPYNDSLLFLACDRSGIVHFNTRKLQAERIRPNIEHTAIDEDRFWVRQYYFHSDTCVFLRTNSGYLQYNPIRQVVSAIKDTNGNLQQIQGMSSLFKDRDGFFWFADEQGKIWRWWPNKSLEAITDSSLQLAILAGENNFFDLDEQHLLISTAVQNFVLNKADFSLEQLELRSRLEDDLGKTTITSLYRTDDGNLFLGFRNGFLGQINPQQQQFQYKPLVSNTENSLNVAFIIDDTLYQKRYFTNYLGNDFFVEDLKTGNIKSFPKQSFSRISSNRILFDSQERLWAVQNEGVVEIDRLTQTLSFHKPDEPAWMLFDMVEIGPGEFVVGSFRNGLYHFKPDEGIFYKLAEKDGWIPTQIFSLFFDAQHNILWIGTVRNGLFRYDISTAQFKQYMPEVGNPKSIGGDWVRSFAMDHQGYLWMTTDPMGLSRFDYHAPEQEAFRNFSIQDGLPSNHASGLVVAADGTLWLSGLNGLASINPLTSEIKQWPIEKGAYNYRFHYANMSVNQSNQILIGTEKGYLQFDPEKLMLNTVPPKVYLTDFVVMDKDQRKISTGLSRQPIELKYNENYFNIEFAVINFAEPERNKVYYQLQGDRSDWQPIGHTNQIYFSKVSPGSYTFRLRAQNGDGVWSENEINIPIVIRPPFWRTTWFFVLMTALFVLILFLAFRYRLQHLLRENQLKNEKQMLQSEMEREMATLEMTALRAQMNPHFIFNCLNSINRFIIVNDNDTASEYLTKFSRLIRQVLDNSRSEKISLEREINTLLLYIEMEKLRFVDKFNFDIQVDEKLQCYQTFIQPMMVQPYVENAIWHGLMPLQEGGMLQISFKKVAGQLVVSVEDNGIGRQRSQAMKTMQCMPQRSHGMKVTAERLAMLNKKVNARAEIIVSDLLDKDEKPCGTRVELILPLDREAPDTITNEKNNIPL